MKASGTFKVDLQPLESYPKTKSNDDLQTGVQLGRMSIDKTFHGELDATSQGEMLSARTSSPSSAGYVAIELVQGKLFGKLGSFVLQHFGMMHEGENRLTLEVVPGSGSNQLVGIRGNMTIEFKNGEHFYEFEYELSP